MSENTVVEARVREIVKGTKGKEDFRLSEDFLTALNAKAKQLVTDALIRADQNSRKTLQPQDL